MMHDSGLPVIGMPLKPAKARLQDRLKPLMDGARSRRNPGFRVGS